MQLHTPTAQEKSRKHKGFTIVELMIIVVVIGILAGIGVTAYSSVQKKAWNVNRLSELSQWEDLFNIYWARNGEYPPHPASSENFFCLGRDFASDACWNPYSRLVKGSTSEPVKYADDGILTALETINPLPTGPRWGIGGGPSRPMGDGVGPIVEYRNGTVHSIWNFYYGPCPTGTSQIWTDVNSSRCEIRMKYDE